MVPPYILLSRSSQSNRTMKCPVTESPWVPAQRQHLTGLRCCFPGRDTCTTPTATKSPTTRINGPRNQEATAAKWSHWAAYVYATTGEKRE